MERKFRKYFTSLALFCFLSTLCVLVVVRSRVCWLREFFCCRNFLFDIFIVLLVHSNSHLCFSFSAYLPDTLINLQIMEYDHILEEIGEFGPFQLLPVILLFLPAAASGAYVLTYSFTGNFFRGIPWMTSHIF